MLVMIGGFIALVMGNAASVSAPPSFQTVLLVKRLIQDQTQSLHKNQVGHVDTAQTTWTT